MTQLGEGVQVGVLRPPAEGPPPKKCKWKNCKTNHSHDIAYPEGGTVDKNGSYASDWVGADLEPWKKYGDGRDSLAQKADFLAETPGASYVSTAVGLKHPAYHTQKHHLVSVKLFKDVPDLSYNGKLVGYDVNHKNNGVCLPSYVADIVRHDLQCHRGNHPNSLYYDHLDPLLGDLEARSRTYCHADFDGDMVVQKGLVGDIDRLSKRTEGQIKSWKWLLRSDATQERSDSKAAYAKRLANQGS
jgi:A nuclease family of the HNH/ENDO VII superfamily with conserved AHH